MIAAVITSRPGRERSLVECLKSLRPQVDTLALVWNAARETLPDAAQQLVDRLDVDPENTLGSGAKLRYVWDVAERGGLYLTADDDLRYPADYAETMRAAVRARPHAIHTLGGRILERPKFTSATISAKVRQDEPARWLNYPNGATLAFTTRKVNPPRCRAKNCEEAELAVWAQQNQTPIYCLAHKGSWVQNIGLTLHPDSATIWNEERALGFTRRDAVLRQHAGKWRVFECS